ncbi:MAG: metallophosphoesterase [Planctomycetota bacterium]|nr:metallophosphoesterase [Planctomycetota bacterium]
MTTSAPDASTPTPAPTASRARLFSRRRFFQLAAGLGVGACATAGYARWVEPFWPEFHEFPMEISGLHEAFEGFRITHLTDLHVSNAASIPYLQGVVERVNDLKPDLVVVTGDLVTQPRPMPDVAIEIIGKLTSPTIVTFGNHDCGIHQSNIVLPNLALLEKLDQGLTRRGCTVLRNRSATIRRGEGTLWVIGMEEIWSGLFDPRAAWTGVPADAPSIVLSHNPDTVPMLTRFAPSWILCGHTHGGQVRLPFYGAIILPVTNRQWDAGAFEVDRSRLYVSRAVGYLHQVRFDCRPEVPTFKLTRRL